MRLVKIKSECIQKSCPLDGVKVVEVREGDYATMSITLMDTAGHVMIVEGGEYSGSVRVPLKAPPRRVKKYRLTGEFCPGTVVEMLIDETFDDIEKAVARKAGLEQHGGSFTIIETEVEVPEE